MGPLCLPWSPKSETANPEFAYLSACHTTVGDEESPDEVIHLAAAMQFVGFRSVIGTMWAVGDGETNEITSTFYKHMVGLGGIWESEYELVADGPLDPCPCPCRHFCDVHAQADWGWSCKSFPTRLGERRLCGCLYVETVFGHSIRKRGTCING